MKGKFVANKKMIAVICALISLVVGGAFFVTNIMKKNVAKTSEVDTAAIERAEMLKAENYTPVKSGDEKIDGCDYVEFNAFFLNDTDGDGNAEKYYGSMQRIPKSNNGVEQTNIYLDFNVKTKGSFKNGVIKFEYTNMSADFKLVTDDIVKTPLSNSLSGSQKGGTGIITLQNCEAGTQRLFSGVINHLENVNLYENYSSKLNKVTLTGTYVAEDGTETNISKTVNFIVDWYGEIGIDFSRYNTTTTRVSDNDYTISFDYQVVDPKNELILKENITHFEIPEFNGYKATSVEVTDPKKTEALTYNYDKASGICTVNLKTEYDNNGERIKFFRLSSSTSQYSDMYNVKITYPKEAFATVSEEVQFLQVNIDTQNIGYNHEKKENPIESKVYRDSFNIGIRNAKIGDIVSVKVSIENSRLFGDYYFSKNIFKDSLYNDIENSYKVIWTVNRGVADGIDLVLRDDGSDSKLNDEVYSKDLYIQDNMYYYVGINLRFIFRSFDDGKFCCKSN